MLSDRYGPEGNVTLTPAPKRTLIETQAVEIMSDNDSDEPMGLPYRMQVLQQEVMMLRGLVEQLSYEIQRSKRAQEDRYLELDRRLQRLSPEARDVQQGQAPNLMTEENVFGVGLSAEKTDRAEKDYYDDGLKAIRSRQYDSAIKALRIVIDQFPTGIYAANAYYWIGEVHAAKPEPDYEAARQALVQVIKGYPASNKVPDAAFKLGKVYHLMGNCQRALTYLTEVKTEFASKSAGKLAERYLLEQVDC
jgi:tol-pal system protein YbgF